MSDHTDLRSRDFDAAWRAAIADNRLRTDFAAAVIRLTRIGSRPAPLTELAAEMHRSVPEITAFVTEYGGGPMRIADGMVYHDHPNGPGPATRWTVHIGERTIYSETGCAPDLFAAAHWLGEQLTVEATCPVTGTPIRVRIGPDGADAEPASTVVSVLNPRGPEFHDIAEHTFTELDEQICSEQTFFASRAAAVQWQAANPGGRLFTVAQLHNWIPRIGF
ncbi:MULTISPECIES: organomercurial lyase [unclassified Nocardia]|uniref:organomercurial lyase n=1 Tax=unclassified Nocardia TaxID=2637762 RepID=UPI001CE41E61|nr:MULTISPECIES: organomercurial lyase [unclassified Nocardia]